MKILKKSIDATGVGFVTIKPEHPEDLWHAYNLISVGDVVTCATFRKVVKVTNTGSSSSSRVKMTLTVEVLKVDFEPKVGCLSLSLLLCLLRPSQRRHAPGGQDESIGQGHERCAAH